MTRREEITKKALELDTTNDIATFVVAAQWADKTMIEKACEWLKRNAEDYVLTCYDKGELDSEGLLMDFRKAMEE